jgi:hypothetical protein
MLTEKEAWLLIAEAKIHKQGVHCSFHSTLTIREYKQDPSYGICHLIDVLENNNLITLEIRKSMREKVRDEKERLNISTPFIWPRTIEGHLTRKAFAKEQADLIHEKD